MIQNENMIRQTLRDIAEKMCLAARTAPKGRGEDNLVIALLESDDLPPIAEKMKIMGEQYGAEAFVRDAKSILSSPVVVLLGTKIKSLGLKKCSMCGFPSCEEKNKHPDTPCVFNTGDLGIAIGSAVSVAMDHRVDNRVMYTIGQAVLDMGLLGSDVKIVYGIPLSATAKNPFFDRKP
ncbi:MAG: DUF2148 domain-containing protein [Candidatus Omnitrophica bacterium]|nr:DUF2148 domain-containing protein [Candidatus Omnitrophota bacterium]